MRNAKIELLAPAGSFQALKAAVQNGADAVYLGGGKFNARINAENFDRDALTRALDYAHERGVKVYITLNTLLKNEELEEALRFAAFVYQQGADAVIVQDCGLLTLLKENLPGLDLHASTQMTVTNSFSVAVLEKLGAKRIILARELSLDEIRSISENCKAELEVFVHGALCVCFSGQCLMSSFIGGRSGNRGLCAQPCRLPWSLSHNGINYSRDAYYLSTRDLMALELLPQIKNAGITSLKLEGRMKSPEYVAIVTSIYRKYIDLFESGDAGEYKVDEKDREVLLQAFNRGGFTQSYLKGDHNSKSLIYPMHPKNQGIYIGKVLDCKPPYVKISLEKSLHIGDGIEIMDGDKGPQSLIVTAIRQNNRHVRLSEAGTSPWVGDVKTHIGKGSLVFRTLSKPLFDGAKKTFEHGEKALIPLNMHLTLKAGEKARLKAIDNEGNSAEAESEIAAEKALNKPLDAERIKEQLRKMGDTPYYLENLYIDTDGKSILPISALNALRRKVIEKIRDVRISKSKNSLDVESILKVVAMSHFTNETGKEQKTFSISQREGNKTSGPLLSVYFSEIPSTLKNLNGMVCRVYLPTGPRNQLEKLKKDFEGEFFLWTPSILKDIEIARVKEELAKVSDLWDGITYGSFGAFQAFKKAFPQKLFCAEYTMNLFNNYALALQKELGADAAVLSPELRLSEVKAVSSHGLELEALVYGRIPLMTMENCPTSAETGCSGACEGCAKIKGYLKDRKGEVFPFVRDPVFKRTQIFNSFPLFMDDIEVLKETPLNTLRITFTQEDEQTREAIVKYYFDRINGREPDDEIEIVIKELKSRGYTKGHWHRGVS